MKTRPSEAPGQCIGADVSWSSVEDALGVVLGTWEAAGAGGASLEDRLAAAASDAPSATTVALLTEAENAPLSASGRVDFLVCVEKTQAWLAFLATRRIVEHVGATDEPGADDPMAPASLERLEQAADREDIRVALRLSDPVVRTRIHVARWLAGPLAATGETLAAGRISWQHALAVAEAAATVDDNQVAGFEAAVLARIPDRDLTFARRVIRRELARRDDADRAAGRHREAAAARSLRRWGLPDGMACLQVVSTADDIETVYQALRVLAGPSDPDDPRPATARAVDSLLSLALSAVLPTGVDGCHPGRSGRPGVTVQLVVDLPTLVGLSQTPAQIPGLGDIPAPVARAWAADAEAWQRLVVDPVDDHLLDLGPVVRRPIPGLDRFVRGRDRTCLFPGCRQPADRADLDHHVPHRADGTGGPTSAANLGALCRHHHRIKTHTRWQVSRGEDGSVQWTSPTGHVHREHRRPLRE
jgi:hypothetical protein